MESDVDYNTYTRAPNTERGLWKKPLEILSLERRRTTASLLQLVLTRSSVLKP